MLLNELRNAQLCSVLTKVLDRNLPKFLNNLVSRGVFNTKQPMVGRRETKRTVRCQANAQGNNFHCVRASACSRLAGRSAGLGRDQLMAKGFRNPS